MLWTRAAAELLRMLLKRPSQTAVVAVQCSRVSTSGMRKELQGGMAAACWDGGSRMACTARQAGSPQGVPPCAPLALIMGPYWCPI